MTAATLSADQIRRFEDYGYHYQQFLFPAFASVMVALDPATRANGSPYVLPDWPEDQCPLVEKWDDAEVEGAVQAHWEAVAP